MSARASGQMLMAESLRNYYAGDIGRRAQQAISTALGQLLTTQRQDRVLGLGYAPPWLDAIAPSVERAVCAMPARQGVHRWPEAGENMACLVDPLSLPFADSLFDWVLMVHLLEHTAEPSRLLREIWRVLAPAGRVLIVVPHPRGRWLLARQSPFLTGQSYNQRQLARLLQTTMFAPRFWSWSLGRPGWHLPALQLVVAAKQDGPQLLPIGKARPVRLQPVGL